MVDVVKIIVRVLGPGGPRRLRRLVDPHGRKWQLDVLRCPRNARRVLAVHGPVLCRGSRDVQHQHRDKNRERSHTVRHGSSPVADSRARSHSFSCRFRRCRSISIPGTRRNLAEQRALGYVLTVDARPLVEDLKPSASHGLEVAHGNSMPPASAASGQAERVGVAAHDPVPHGPERDAPIQTAQIPEDHAGRALPPAQAGRAPGQRSQGAPLRRHVPRHSALAL